MAARPRRAVSPAHREQLTRRSDLARRLLRWQEGNGGIPVHERVAGIWFICGSSGAPLRSPRFQSGTGAMEPHPAASIPVDNECAALPVEPGARSQEPA